MTSFKILFSIFALAAMLSGCATSQNSQQSASPTVSGYISVGGEKNIK
jgi:PBP1b-binding outer membrane lipoprotein LpoB